MYGCMDGYIYIYIDNLNCVSLRDTTQKELRWSFGKAIQVALATEKVTLGFIGFRV